MANKDSMNSQLELWNSLNENNTLQEVQKYIKNVIEIRSFANQEIEKTMLLLLEEVGELAKSIRKNATNMSIDKNKINHYDTIESEVADVFIVLNSVCNKLNIDLFKALKDKEEQNIKRNWVKEDKSAEVNEELKEYIEKEIFPLYDKNEEGHGVSHIRTVIQRSLNFAKDYNVNVDIVYTVAAYHDLGNHIDRKKHEIISAEIFMKDEKIKKWFTDEQRKIIKEAIEDHRASSKHEPRTIYGMIVSTADRAIIDIDNSIKRSYSYGKRNYIGLSEEEQIERVYNHLLEKYGENGYAKVYIEDKEFDEAIKKLREALSNKEEFIERVKKVVKAH